MTSEQSRIALFSCLAVLAALLGLLVYSNAPSKTSRDTTPSSKSSEHSEVAKSTSQPTADGETTKPTNTNTPVSTLDAFRKIDPSKRHLPQPVLIPVSSDNGAQLLANTRKREFISNRLPTRVDLPILQAGAQGIVDKLLFEFPDGLRIESQISNRIIRDGIENFTLMGDVNGEAGSKLMVSVYQDTVTAVIRSGSIGQRKIQYLGNGLHQTFEIDPSKLPGCASSEPHEVIDPRQRLATPSLAADLAATEGDTTSTSASSAPDGSIGQAQSIVQVMVLFTPQARINMGGTISAISQINLAIDETNSAYIASGVEISLVLAHQQEIQHTELFPHNENLYALTNRSDGIMDEVHQLRDSHGADMVCLVGDYSGSFCGVAWIMSNISPSFQSSAFSLVNDGCLVGNYTFGHELGHNMGCAHAPGDGGQTGGGPFPYSQGHRWTSADDGELYRSVMAYSPGVRTEQFSNPNVLFLGTPTGVPNVADNVRSIQQAKDVVAAWRSGGGPGGTDDHGNTIATSTLVSTPSSSTSGDLETTGDIDVFGFTVAERSVATISTTGGTDTFGELLTAAGGLLASDDNSGSLNNFGLSQSVPAGTYYIAVSSNVGDTGTYQLQLNVTSSTSLPGLATNVQASDGTFANRVEITWQAANRATSYRVYRNINSSSNTAVEIANGVIGTTYNDFSATPGTTYYYWIRGENTTGLGNLSGTNSGYALPRPSSVSQVDASDGDFTNRVQITWDASPFASSYRVFNSLTNNPSTSTFLGNTVTPIFQHTTPTSGRIYYYWVIAENAAGSSATSPSDDGFARTVTGGLYYEAHFENGIVSAQSAPNLAGQIPTAISSGTPEIANFSNGGVLHLNPGTTPATGIEGIYFSIGEGSPNYTIEYDLYIDQLASITGEEFVTRLADEVNQDLIFDPTTSVIRYLLAGRSSASEVDLSGNIGTYAEDQWYHVKLEIDETTETWTVTLNGTQILSSPFRSSFLNDLFFQVTDINLSGNTSVYLDNIRVTDGRAFAPTPPTALAATDETHLDRVNLTWNAVADAATYNIYRHTTSDFSTSQQIASSISGTSFNDLTAIISTDYYYWVTAVNNTGESKESHPDAGRRFGIPPAPQGLTATDGTLFEQVRLSWSTTPGTANYSIYRALSNNFAQAVNIGTTSNLAFTDNNVIEGTNYYYWVRSNNINGSSTFSGPESGFPMRDPDAPTSISATDGTRADRIEVQWVTGFLGTSYRLLRNTVNDINTATQVATTTNLSWNDTSAAPATYYYYWVRAENMAGVSPYTSANRGHKLTPTPSGFSATDFTEVGHVAITWDSVPGVDTYEIRRHTLDFRNSSQLVTTIQATDPLIFRDYTIAFDRTYYYWIRATGPFGTSSYSESDAGTMRFPAPLVPTSVSASDYTKVRAIDISWAPAQFALNYHLYRSKINDPATATKIKTSSETSYTDRYATAGVYYFYWVRSENQSDLSAFSTSDTGISTPPGNARSKLPSDVAADPSSSDVLFNADRAGLFAGLITDQTDESALLGELTQLKVKESKGTGVASGKIDWQGQKVSLKGTVNGDGSFSQVYLIKKTKETLTIDLQLVETDFRNATKVVGTITSDTGKTGIINAIEQKVFHARDFPAYNRGSYTMVMPANLDWKSDAPLGDGYASMRIDPAGRSFFKGALGDGTRYSDNAYMSLDYEILLYFSTYRGDDKTKGYFGGKLQREFIAGISDWHGTFSWMKPTRAKAKYYPAGFDLNLWALACKFTPGTPRLLDGFDEDERNTVLTFENGNLDFNPSPIECHWYQNNKIGYLGYNHLNAKVNPRDGLLKGSLKLPLQKFNLKFGGVVFQKQGYIFGNFLGNGESGRVIIQKR